MVRGQLIFVSGGVRSGKSKFSEALLLQQEAQDKRLVYIASGRATDAEMAARIRRHRDDRRQQAWTTIEQPTNFPAVLPQLQKGDLLLWDCLTTWLANELYEGWEKGIPCIQEVGCMEKKEVALFQAIDQVLARVSTFVLVSNEVLHDLPTGGEETEIYRKWLGSLHQKIVSRADVAIEMEAGLPIYWKGRLDI